MHSTVVTLLYRECNDIMFSSKDFLLTMLGVSLYFPLMSHCRTLPNHVLLPQIDSFYRVVCVHAYSGSLLYQQLLLTVQCLLALSFTIGYETRISSVLSWFLYMSLTLRNTWLNFILDRYFHYLLFYAMFLPLDRVWCLNKKNIDHQYSSSTIVSIATFAMKAQVLWIYLDAGFGKYMDPLGGWSLNAQPIPALDSYARHTTIARYMYALLGPTGLRLMTPSVVYVEILCAPVALFGSLIGNRSIVLTSIFLTWSLHIGISLTVRNTVLLSLVACCAWCPFLPPIVTNKTVTNEQSLQSSTHKKSKKLALSLFTIPLLISGCVWFETMSEECNQSMKHVWSVLLHNRWNVFVGAEE